MAEDLYLLTNEETESEKAKITCPKLDGQRLFESKQSGSRACALNCYATPSLVKDMPVDCVCQMPQVPTCLYNLFFPFFFR